MFVWFPLLEAGCGGLDHWFVFVLVVWYGALKDVVCVYLGEFKSHRASVDCLWQNFTAMHACVCEWVHVLVTLWVTRAFPQSCRLFSSNKIPAHSTSCSWEGACDPSGILSISQWCGSRFGQECCRQWIIAISASQCPLQRSDIMLTHQPLSATVWRLTACSLWSVSSAYCCWLACKRS